MDIKCNNDEFNRSYIKNTRGRDILWLMTLAATIHLGVIFIISAGWTAAYLTITIFILFTNVLCVFGVNDAIDDIAATIKDGIEDENEDETHLQRRSAETAWQAFKLLISAGLGLTLISEVYLMWFA